MAEPDGRDAHEIIADSYYDGWRLTARSFDLATRRGLADSGVALRPGSLLLEAGCGRGRAREFLDPHDAAIIHMDISGRMLRLPEREECRARAQASARSMPFRDGTFDAVAAFLFDAFNLPAFHLECRRVLKAGGVFIGTLPHYDWAASYRQAKGLPMDAAIMKDRSGSEIRLESYVMPEWEIIRAFEEAGFASLRLESFPAPADAPLSPHVIEDSAGNLPPIVQLAIARA